MHLPPTINQVSANKLAISFDYSALMTTFYLYKIATGGNHIPTKAE
ncbi:hypothetical protein CK203_021453 [Vitis vinifera]|uniref:Uncharacterized protein n=1 Tax=Vitis vinifera TaxID=29760 RepID=A0A438ISE5_VITVI|nr:hypothetical protein CK203_021453 [Vitis vinifera]